MGDHAFFVAKSAVDFHLVFRIIGLVNSEKNMIIGPYINALAIISGAIIGSVLGGRIPERLRTNLTLIFGLCSMGMGIVMVAKTTNMPAMILSVLLGTIIGELLLLEQGINKLASSAKGLVEKMFPDKPSSMPSQEEFLSKFVAIVVLFSFSGTGIFGAMNEGMSGNFDILIVKSFLDFFTAMIFATSLGISVASIFVPQTLVQVRGDFAAVGGMLMIAAGFRICNIQMFHVANMLPALFLAMPISHFWSSFF